MPALSQGRAAHGKLSPDAEAAGSGQWGRGARSEFTLFPTPTATTNPDLPPRPRRLPLRFRRARVEAQLGVAGGGSRTQTNPPSFFSLDLVPTGTVCPFLTPPLGDVPHGLHA